MSVLETIPEQTEHATKERPHFFGTPNADKMEMPVIKRWFADKGDQTLRVDYPLTKDSVVIDVGGYEGNWAAQIDERYGCTIHIFEPVPAFAAEIAKRFAGRSNVHVHVAGIANASGNATIYVNNDSTSVHKHKGEPTEIVLRSAEQVFTELGLRQRDVDLMKINIEGCEFELLRHLIEISLIRQIRDIQVQFHDFVHDASPRMEQLQQQLSRTHELTWQYRFVWENWRRKPDVSPSGSWTNGRTARADETVTTLPKATTANLLSHARNVHSQSGEDGILEAIFHTIPTTGQRWSVEFGAWDGKKFSNTCNLVSHHGWHGAFIEADPVKFADLQRTYAANPRAFCIKAFVTFDGTSSLDAILEKSQVPPGFDLLSIDIDGNDYHIWDSVKRLRPKVVIIEFNPAIPNNISFVQARNMEVRQGSSLLALTNLGKSKGYELVCVTELNAIFVRREYFPLFGIQNNSPDALHTDTRYITQVFQLYDGTLVWEGCKKLLWHDVPIKAEKMQVLPEHLRFFMDPELPADKKRLLQQELPKYR